MKLKKLLAIVLCVAMVLSTMSFNVFAEDYVAYIADVGFETIEKAINAAQAGDTVTIKEGTYEVPSMKAGITVVGDGDVLLVGTLTGTLENLTLKNLRIKGGNAQRWAYAKGDLVFENVTFEATSVYAIHFDGITEGTNLTYKDCTIIGWAAMGGSPASCVFDGCTIKDNGAYGVIRTYFNAEIKDCTFDVDGANPNDAYQDGIHAVDATVQVNNCTNANGDMKDIINISMEGYIYIDDDLVLAPVAKVGDEYYPTLAEAVANANKGDTIVIYSKLDELATLVNNGTTFNGLTVKLGADIDLKGEEWTPIGNSTNKFQGVFDGDNHTISNLVITGSKSNAGLFGFTTNGEIKNLTVENASVSGRLNVGVVAGTPYTSKYTNITVKGHVEVNGMSYVGGVGGKNAYADWTDITVDVDDTSYVKAVSTEDGVSYRTYVGGVIGFMGEGGHTVKNVTSNIDVIGDVCDIGGIVGIAHYGNKFENVTCSGNVTNTNTDAADATETGGIAGVWHNQEKQTVTFTNCIYTGKVTATGVAESTAVGVAYNAKNTGEQSSGQLIVNGEKVWPAIAKIGDSIYSSLTAAVENAADNGTITVIENINAKDAETLNINKNIVIDLNGKRVNGSILAPSGNITVKNGSIVNKNAEVSGIEINSGKLTLENVNIDSARHAVRIDGAVEAVIDGGKYTLNATSGTRHAVNVSGAANVTIKDGTFIGPKGTTMDSGSAVCVQSGATVTIEDGKFSGGKNATLGVSGTLTINGGLFDQNPATYVAQDYEAVETGEDEYLYSVEPLDAPGVKVAFVSTDKPNIYDIVLKSTSYQKIYEFVAAEFVFVNDSETVGEKEMGYEILGIEGKTVVEQAASDYFNNDQYIIRIPRGEIEHRLTGREITIGQVKFIGEATTQFQGNIKFKVDRAEVDATERKTHLGYYYTTDAGTLTVVNAEDSEYAIDGGVAEIKRNVAVNVAFNHNIDTADYWNGYQITATLKNNFGCNITKNITIEDAKTGAVTFENVPLGQISVTLKAPGFRTYTYKTVVEGTEDNGVLVLNFWNDVKRENDEVIENGKDKMAHNFLVGDIVMDYTVDKYDLAAVTSYYGTYGIDKAEAEKYIKYDLNRDGDIDIRDVQYVLHTMGN